MAGWNDFEMHGMPLRAALLMNNLRKAAILLASLI